MTTTDAETIIIAGAGQAAGQTAVSLRQKGHAGPIIMLGAEAYLPYQRPPLSKAYLAGSLATERLHIKPQRFWAEHDIETRLGVRVIAIDRAAHTVTLDDGATLTYGKLVLATGSRVRELTIPGHELAGVHYLRTIADVQGIQPGFRPGQRLTIVGGGYIGLEVAAVAVKHGLEVTVIETESRVMNRVVAPEVSRFFQELHRAAGVKIELGRRVAALTGATRVTAVECSDGLTVPTDLCIIGVGIVPNVELAQAAGLPCTNGIDVDEFCQTADTDVLAVGDCTWHPNAVLGRQLRLESVHNAIEQGKTAAATLCGQPAAYTQVPWFWSDQYDIKLQIAGLSTGYDQVVLRGDPADHAFAACYLLHNRLLAVDAVNSPREFMLGKKLIAAGATLDSAAIADPKQDFKALATAALAAAG
jgi:3-phenylpropionate/trans-cinnamate dioxygenase ferredoxin reductase subunit